MFGKYFTSHARLVRLKINSGKIKGELPKSFFYPLNVLLIFGNSEMYWMP